MFITSRSRQLVILSVHYKNMMLNFAFETYRKYLHASTHNLCFLWIFNIWYLILENLSYTTSSCSSSCIQSKGQVGCTFDIAQGVIVPSCAMFGCHHCVLCLGNVGRYCRRPWFGRAPWLAGCHVEMGNLCLLSPYIIIYLHNFTYIWYILIFLFWIRCVLRVYLVFLLCFSCRYLCWMRYLYWMILNWYHRVHIESNIS